MQCTKTGAHVYLEEYGEWVYGDAFVHKDILVLNLVYRSRNENGRPARPVKHYTVHNIEHWFSENQTSQEHTSVLVASAWTDHGYDGVSI